MLKARLRERDVSNSSFHYHIRMSSVLDLVLVEWSDHETDRAHHPIFSFHLYGDYLLPLQPALAGRRGCEQFLGTTNIFPSESR